MSEDPIVKETRAAREELLKRFNYDLDALCAYLQTLEAQSEKKSVTWSHGVQVHSAKSRNAPAPAN